MVLALLIGCNSESEPREAITAQMLIDRAVAKNPRVVRLTIHATKTGDTKSTIIACNLAEKVGKTSDPEDLDAMKTGKTTVQKEGDALDITMPIFDAHGKAIAASGVTIKTKKDEPEEQTVAKAKSIVESLQKEIQSYKKPLW